MKQIKFIVVLLIIILGLTLSACNSSANRVEQEVFTVNMNSLQIPIGEIEVQFATALGFGGLRKNTVEVIYFPREDAVALQYRRDFITYHQFWSRNGRAAFINALQQYNEDFDARNLNRNGGRRTLRTYGVAEGFLVWQQWALAVQARGNMNKEFGYTFRERLPYFTVNQREADYEDPLSRDNNRTSMVITMFFTRAQAAELAVLFDQHFLRELASPESLITPSSNRDPARDDYWE
jgi:hypothetical protein